MGEVILGVVLHLAVNCVVVTIGLVVYDLIKNP